MSRKFVILTREEDVREEQGWSKRQSVINVCVSVCESQSHTGTRQMELEA